MHLTLNLLGPPQVQLDRTTATTSRRAVIALLAYLAVNDPDHAGRRCTRESASSLLWPNYGQSKALANLRHILWETAKFIGDGWILSEHETIHLNPERELLLDMARFRSLLKEAAQRTDSADRVPLLSEACSLYREDFMSGFSLRDGASFNEWVAAEAEVLLVEFTSALDVLSEDYLAIGQSGSAITNAQRRIAKDPFNEAAHRQLMRLYVLTDQSTAAIQQYERLRKILRKELDVDPQPETRDLHKAIRRESFKAVVPARQTLDLVEPGRRHNLPVQLTAFVGRDKERDDVSRLVTQHRLVTLIGAGGIGKTRLSLQAGETLVSQFQDGVWFIPLESIADGDLVPQAIASGPGSLNLQGQPGLESLTAALRGRRMLLILDNCEHLLDACAQAAETLLKNCPGLRILATSRNILRVQGEASYFLPPLSAPSNVPTESMEDLAGNEAVQLFAQRAALASSGFRLTGENIPSVIGICNRLDGIPLAIELAAAHVDVFSVEEILAALHRSFDLLSSQTRSVLPRHQTMRTSIDWSWSLLRDSERIFMRQLSVFMGGWTLNVLQAIGISSGRELTTSLVTKSLVVVHQQAGQETRYRFHEIVRSYAQEKLVAAGEEEGARDRHLDYFLKLVEQLKPAFKDDDRTTLLDRLSVERDNLHAALEWAAKSNVQAGLDLAASLRTFWESYPAPNEARWLLGI